MAMNKMLPWLTPALLAVIAGLLAAIFLKMPEKPVTYGEWMDAGKTINDEDWKKLGYRTPFVRVESGDARWR